MTLADPGGPSPPVQLHQILTGWQFGDVFAVVAFSVQVLAALWYVGAVTRLSRKGRSWSRWRTTSFLAGLLMLTIALVSGLASYDDSVFVVHVIQHLIIMMVAPPLLSLGAPVTLGIQASKRPTQIRIVHLLHTPLLKVLTSTLVAAVLYYASMYVYLVTSFYPFALRHPVAHNASHLVMFVLACLFWWPMIAVDQLPNRPSFPARIIAMFLGMPFEVFLGLAVMNMSHPIAPEHTLADTRAGGAVFWGASMLITFAAALVLLAQWMGEEERKAARADRHPDAREARRLSVWEEARRAKLGTSPSRPVSVDRGPGDR